MKYILKNNNTLIFFLLVLSACAPSTRISGSWVNPEADQKYNNILVAAMTENVRAKQMIEDALTDRLSAKGINTTKSIELFPPNFRKEQMDDKQAMLNQIHNNGSDAILTVALIDKETENRYVPGNATYAPLTTFSYYGSFWGYYTTWYPEIYTPGYYTQDKVYVLEANLYDASTENLVWSAQSTSVNPGSLENFSKDFAQVIVDELSDKHLL